MSSEEENETGRLRQDIKGLGPRTPGSSVETTHYQGKKATTCLGRISGAKDPLGDKLQSYTHTKFLQVWNPSNGN